MFECENCGRKQENGHYVCLNCGTHRNKQTDSERKNKDKGSEDATKKN